MRRIIFTYLTISLIIFTSCKENNKIVEIDKKIPSYTFADVLNCPEQIISIDDFKGKPVIIEFWATWCAGCLPAMKKLDSLQTKFKDKLEIITVSSDDRDRLKRFIETTNTNLRIAFDTAHYDIFKYQFIPHTIIIDKFGIVRAITSPENINDSIINKLITENEIDLVLKNDFSTDTSQVKTIYQSTDTKRNIKLTNYNPTEASFYKTNLSLTGTLNGMEFHNLALPSIFELLYNVPSQKRIVFSNDIKDYDLNQEENLYNLTIEVSTKYENQINEIAISFLNNYFDLNAKMKIDSLDCYVLLNITDMIQESSSENFEYSSRGPNFHGRKIPIKLLTRYLENLMPIPVIDQTGLTKKYDIELNWQLEDSKTIHSELNKYGLKLQKSATKLPIEVMEVYQKNK